MKNDSSPIPLLATTGIGSLPHHDLEDALCFGFATDIPFYPTLPARHPHEGMLAQAIDNFPGISVLSTSQLRIDPKIWQQNREEFTEKLSEDFNRNRYHDWLPSSHTSCWQSFLMRLTGYSGSWVKTQITGPVTLGKALQGLESESTLLKQEVMNGVADLLVAKALAMAAEFRFRQKQTLLFVDEPGLSGFGVDSITDAFAFEKLQALLQELKSHGIKLGLHCCGNTDFSKLLTLPIDYLSIDVALSMDELLKNTEAMQAWFEKGGRLSLGIVPTKIDSRWNATEAALGLQKNFQKIFTQDPSQVEKILAESLLSPACGLGLSRLDDVEWFFAALTQVQAAFKRWF